ncbi:MAG TPA: amidohydrolase [Nakamurella sp.]|nr:amidohydrolase [Nakamurella sp.]
MAQLDAGELTGVYRDLHAHPELGFRETRTAGIVAEQLTALGYRVTTGVGGTGVVGLLGNGAGPVVLLRADMDGLPVAEETGLPYASTDTGVDREGRDGPVMHACGHDMHMSCLLGAAQVLADDRNRWSGTLMLVFQPAEELGQGAKAMVRDGLFERFEPPAVLLGQHVAPFPAGLLAIRPGTAFAASDSLRVRLFGRGGHGSRPESAIDPVVLAAGTVLRLQTIVSRELAAAESAVLTVGALHAGTAANVIPDDAELLLSIRTFDLGVRSRVLAAVERIVRGEAAAAGATRDPEVLTIESFPAVVNDIAASARTTGVWQEWLGPGRVIDPGPIPGSEDVGVLATAAGCPCVFWLLGGADPALFANGLDLDVLRNIPSNHSPRYAPVIEPTLTMGVGALVRAALAWLPVTEGG